MIIGGNLKNKIVNSVITYDLLNESVIKSPSLVFYFFLYLKISCRGFIKGFKSNNNIFVFGGCD